VSINTLSEHPSPLHTPNSPSPGLTWRQGKLPDDQTFAVIKAALESGCNYFNGGEFYGPPDNNSLTLLRAYYEHYPEDRDKILLNVKGCITPDLKPDSSPEGVRKSVENSVRLIGGKGRIDQFEPARKDKNVEIEETLKALQAEVEKGNIGGISLSEVSAATIRRAAKVAKIESVEVELSLWCTEPLENGVLEACGELGITVLAYCEFFSLHLYLPSYRPHQLTTAGLNSPARPRHAHRPLQISRRPARGRLPAVPAAVPA
jgi:pyridoxine 4-dehydrogenase